MKRNVRWLSLVVALSFVVSLFAPLLAVFPASAADASGDARYTQKIVTVVWDNSSSMEFPGGEARVPGAKYALAMLASMLDERDKLTVVPMNYCPSGGIELKLSDPANRDRYISEVLSNSLLRPSGNTPDTSLKMAIDLLAADGLKDANNQWAAESDKEYWLVVLTDGEFIDQGATKNLSQPLKIDYYIKNYPTLNTVFIPFDGVDLKKIDASGYATLCANNPHFKDFTTTASALASTMQIVANTMSGRYNLESEMMKKALSVSGNTVTIDLSHFEFSLASLSIIAQNCGATVTSVTYDGTALKAEKPCVYNLSSIDPSGYLKYKENGKEVRLKNGYSCEVSGNPYFLGGKLSFTFTSPIDPQYLTVFAEPALKISSHLEYQNGSNWERVDLQYVNEHLKENDRIRVGYEVREQVNDTVVDLGKVFGAVEASVVYAGSTYQMGEEIPLKLGSHPFSIEVSVMDGAYTLRAADTITIEEEPSYYRIEVEGDDTVAFGQTATSLKGTVYVNNVPASKDVLKNYKWSVSVQKPGEDSDAWTEIPAALDGDGRIVATLNVDPALFGTYKVKFFVSSEYNITRNAVHTVSYALPNFGVTTDGIDRISHTRRDFETNTDAFRFQLTLGGNPISFTDPDVTYRLTVDGVDVTSNATVSGNVLSYVPKLDHLAAQMDIPGDKIVSLEVSHAADPSLTASTSAILTVVPTELILAVSGTDHLSITQYDFGKNTDGFRFELTSDGRPFGFKNSLITYKLTVDGVDVTANTTVNGNALEYVPHKDHLSSVIATPGDKRVVLTIDCKEFPALSTSGEVKLTVIETVYTVESVPNGNKTVDRFRLDKTEGTLAFRVLRDGKVIPLDELQAAMDDGTASVKLKSTFTNPLLPVGATVTVETLDSGDAAVVIRTTKDIDDPLAWFLSMFILGTDKPTTLTFGSAEATDTLTFAPSATWEYLLRITVLLLIIGFIVYVILYIIGFKKTALLPNGAFIVVTPSDETSSVATVHAINNPWSRVILFHLSRLLIWRIWSIQPLRPNEAKRFSAHKVQHRRSDEGDAIFGLNVSSSPKCWKLMPNPAKQASLNTIIDDVVKGSNAVGRHRLAKMPSLFSKVASPLQTGANCDCNGVWYSCYDKDSYNKTVLMYAITFVHRKRKFR